MRVEAFIHDEPWPRLQGTARAAEAAGFDAVACPEITNDPLQTLTVAALATTQVSLRTAILVAFPRSPMVVATAARVLHENSGGRLVLGLGTQVRPHVERRFGATWPGAPARALEAYVGALRAIWRCWQTGGPLRYDVDPYRFSLMTPEFAHAPSAFGPIPVYTAAVRPAMLRLAGRVADGVRLHGFCTRRYLEEVVAPELATGLTQSGRARDALEVCGGGFVATGPDDDAVRAMVEKIRYRVAFYASTPAYLPVMQLHGWDDLAARLHHLSRVGRWAEMAAAVPDDVLRAFTVVAPWRDLPDAIAARFGGVSDAVELAFTHDTPVEPLREVLAAIRAIPCAFARPPTWTSEA
jgi:probable F420-dependent oxidoreductase